MSIYPKTMAIDLNDLIDAIPKFIDDWSAKGNDRSFDSRTIFDYINGGAEVYRAYNMRKCVSRRYEKKDSPSIVLDIFDMGSSGDAFGVFTHDRDGEMQSIGSDGVYKTGWLSFWKDRFFISIYMDEENEEAEKTVINLGKTIDGIIKEEGSRPSIINALPQNGLLTQTIRYLHHPTILNFHFYLADDNILNIGPQTPSAMAEYLIDKQKARLLIIDYPNNKEAQKSLKNLEMYYLPDADAEGLARLEDGKWAAAELKGNRLALVLEADDKQIVHNLIKQSFER
jgi:hypothetical protein